MHWIQNHIIVELVRFPTQRYSQLRPRDVEGNLFMYHLKGLIADGIVEKIDREYQLSIKGLQHAGTLSLATGKTRQQPKILTAVVCRNDAGEYLFSRWHRQPNTGLASFPHGMVHFGQTIKNMAAQELSEKAGLKADLTYCGEVYVRGMRGEMVDRHMLVHIFKADGARPDKAARLRPDVSVSFWAPLRTVLPTEFVPGFYEIATIVDTQPTSIFEEIVVDIA